MANNETPTALIINARTGEEIIRPLNTDELFERKAMELEEAEFLAQKQAKAEARTSALAKLAALGLTEDEIGAL